MKRICKDCYYFIPAPSGMQDRLYAKCDASKELNLVTGEWEYNFCNLERESKRPEACGANAQHYEEPEPREDWQRDEPQGVTNWDTGWNAVYAQDNGVM